MGVVSTGTALLIGTGIATATTVGTTAYAASQQRKAAGKANDRRRAAEEQVRVIKNEREDIVNPYRNASDLSSLVKDLSGEMSNPYAELGVATQAAEIQMEQTDIALANTLDTLRATGASAGGATALAQAALQGKKGVAASIEQQEAQNAKLRAQGDQILQNNQQNEARRLQQVAFSEGQRLQGLDAAGQQYMFQQRENRNVADLDRASGVVTQAQQDIAQANSAQAGIVAAGINSVGNIMSSGVAAYSAYQNNPSTNPASMGSQTVYTPPVDEFSIGYGFSSDRRLKKNIIKIDESDSGLNIYSFEYLDTKFGEGVYQGVMSDEVPVESVLKGEDGYDRVDYSKLDVEFKKLSNEL